MPIVREGIVIQEPCIKCHESARCRLDYWTSKDRQICEYLDIDFEWYKTRLQVISENRLNAFNTIRICEDDKGNKYGFVENEGVYYVCFQPYYRSYATIRRCVFTPDVEYINDMTDIEFRNASLYILLWHEGYTVNTDNGGMPSFRDYTNYQMLRMVRKVRRKSSGYKTLRNQYVNEEYDGPQGLDNFGGE